MAVDWQNFQDEGAEFFRSLGLSVSTVDKMRGVPSARRRAMSWGGQGHVCWAKLAVVITISLFGAACGRSPPQKDALRAGVAHGLNFRNAGGIQYGDKETLSPSDVQITGAKEVSRDGYEVTVDVGNSKALKMDCYPSSDGSNNGFNCDFYGGSPSTPVVTEKEFRAKLESWHCPSSDHLAQPAA